MSVSPLIGGEPDVIPSLARRTDSLASIHHRWHLGILVFAWIDPSTLILAGLPLDEKGVYSLAFFVFWGFVSVAALLSHWWVKLNTRLPGVALVADTLGLWPDRQDRPS